MASIRRRSGRQQVKYKEASSSEDDGDDPATKSAKTKLKQMLNEDSDADSDFEKETKKNGADLSEDSSSDNEENVNEDLQEEKVEIMNIKKNKNASSSAKKSPFAANNKTSPSTHGIQKSLNLSDSESSSDEEMAEVRKKKNATLGVARTDMRVCSFEDEEEKSPTGQGTVGASDDVTSSQTLIALAQSLNKLDSAWTDSGLPKEDVKDEPFDFKPDIASPVKTRHAKKDKSTKTPAKTSRLDDTNMDSISKLLAAGENLSEGDSDDDNSDGEDDTANDNSEQQSNQHAFPAEGIQVTISMPGKSKRKKKDFDVQAFVKRELSKARHKTQELMHQSHFVCLVAHLHYVNSVLCDPTLRAAALSIIPPAHTHKPANVTLMNLAAMVSWIRDRYSLDLAPGSELITRSGTVRTRVLKVIETYFPMDLFDQVCVFILVCRALGLDTRLVMNLDVVPLKPQNDDKKPAATKAKTSPEPSTTETKSKNATKRKLKGSDSEGDEEEYEKSKAKGPKKSLSSKLAEKKSKENSKIKVEPKDKSSSKDKSHSSRNNSSKEKSSRDKSSSNSKSASNDKSFSKDKSSSSRDKSSSSRDKSSSTRDKSFSSRDKSSSSRDKSSSHHKSTSNDKSSSNEKSSARDKSSSSRDKSSSSRDKSSSSRDKSSSSRNKSSNGNSSLPDASPSVAKPSSRSSRAKSRDEMKNEEEIKNGVHDKEEDRLPKRKACRAVIEIINNTKGEERISGSQVDGSNDLSRTKKSRKHSVSSSDEDFEPSNNTHTPSSSNKKKQQTKKRKSSGEEFEFSPPGPSKSSRNSIVPKKKPDTSLNYWVEVYLEKEKKWICVDLFNGKTNKPPEIEKRLAKPIFYILSVDNKGFYKDVTRRYASDYMTSTRKIRYDEKWIDKTLKKYTQKSNTAKAKQEDLELSRKAEEAPMPTTVSGFKSHPLYALKRHLLKFEAIYPPEAPSLGWCRSEPVYARECVHTLQGRTSWLKEGRVVKVGEDPYKIVTARPKYDRMTGTVVKDQPLECFGHWQTQLYVPPPAKDGKVPRNEYGNVELFKPWMLPKGTVHIPITGLQRVLRKLSVDAAPAMMGWEFSGGGCHPVFDGYVVCEEYADLVVDAWNQDQKDREEKAEEKREKRIVDNWRRLVKGLFIRERIQSKYMKK